MSVLLLLAAALAGVHAGAVSEALSSGPLSVSPAEVALPSHIMSRPPARQVDEEPLEPLPLRPAPGPPALPGTISFPNERLKQADDRADTAEDWDWDEMYNGCGSTKNCLGFPAGCSDLKSCRGLVTVQVINGTFRFRMRASDAKWVAVGLGDTNKMYDTSVIECVYDDATGKVNTFLSYTSKQDPRSCTRISLSGVEKAAITLERSKSMDNGLYCEVSRLNRTKPTPPGKDYWLDATPYFLQAASGTKADSDKIRFHGENKAAAARATRLDVYTDTGTASNWPMRLHGALMVLAWMFAATAGTLAARYFKAAWGKATICGKAMWFAWHRGFMVLTVLLHGVAVISALIFLEGWSSSSGLHGILGGVTTGLALLQGLGGLLRPDLDHKYRPIFNWAHRLQGFISHTLAIITIFLAVALPGARLPTYTYYILAAYVVFYIALHAVHSLTEVQSYYFVVIVFGSAVFAITMLILVVIGPGS